LLFFFIIIKNIKINVQFEEVFEFN